MLPDFKKVKEQMNRDLFRWVRDRVPIVTPLIQGVATFVQHEGRLGKFRHADDCESAIDYSAAGFDLVIQRDEMREFDLERLQSKLTDLARRIGQSQAKRMLEAAGEAADSVGNVVHAGGELTADKLLDVFRRVEMDFDERTLEPSEGFQWVMHPDTADSVLPKMKQWEQDPVFNAEYEAIMTIKREEWRDREARRKLVD